jgi:hypothetical protein
VDITDVGNRPVLDIYPVDCDYLEKVIPLGRLPPQAAYSGRDL